MLSKDQAGRYENMQQVLLVAHTGGRDRPTATDSSGKKIDCALEGPEMAGRNSIDVPLCDTDATLTVGQAGIY